MTDKIPVIVYNELRDKFKKSDSLTYLKELCENYKEDIEEFTCAAMMAAYQSKRFKALDYMLNLPGRHPANLLVKIQTQLMMFQQKEFEKGGKAFILICKHFNRTEILEELQNCVKSKSNDIKVQERF